MANSKQFVVIGLGRFGESVAKTLYSLGHDVLVIDMDEDSVQEISDSVTHAVQMDATDENALKTLGLRNFDVAVVTIGSNIQASVMITLLVKELGVKYIIAKGQSDLHAKVLYKIGADRVVLPEKDMGVRVAHNLVSASILDFIELSPDYSIMELRVLNEWSGKTLNELKLRSRYGINIMAIKRGEDIDISPRADDILSEDDIIVAIGSADDLSNLEDILIRKKIRGESLIVIESKDNTLFKYTKKLKERKYRTKENKYIIEGFRLVQEAFKAKCNIDYIIVNEYGKDKLNDYLYKYMDSIKIYEMKNELFSQLSSTENTQGIVAVANINNSISNIDGDFYLLCDKVQDPGNLGTIIRTAHAAGVNAIILTKGTVDIYNDKTIRSTMGSIFYIPIIYDNDLSILKGLKERGFSLVATSLEESKNFFDEDLSGKVILSVGNEGNGISKEIFSIADKKVKIPMPGGAESLNVGVATSIILFERVRQSLL